MFVIACSTKPARAIETLTTITDQIYAKCNSYQSFERETKMYAALNVFFMLKRQVTIAQMLFENL